MNVFCGHCRLRATRFSRSVGAIIFFFGVFAFITCLPSGAFSEPQWNTDIDATDPAFLQKNAFAEIEYGYTDVVPPMGLPRRYRTTQSADGYAWEMQGTELSLWQLAPVPESARYLLQWNFLYEGCVTAGRGRTGFIFGNPVSSNLMSVEVTAMGSLRVVMWGRQGFDRQGQIIFSRQAVRNASSVKIEAAYDIRTGTMVCRVNDGEKIVIDFRKYTPSAPITIRGVGFFSAVPEARRNMSTFGERSDSDYDIDLSPQWTKTLHRGLAVSAQ